MLDKTLSVLPDTLNGNMGAMDPGIEQFALTTEESLPETDIATIPEKSIENGISDFVVDNYERIGKFDFNSLRVESLVSGFNCFDRHFVLKRGKAQLVTLAAYTSHGKTAMMMQIAAHVAKEGPVFVHSFEMSKSELETRLLAAVANYPAEKIMRGDIPKSKLKGAIEEYDKRHLYLCKSTENTVPYIQTSCFEKAKQVGKPALIVVDYLQLMQSNVSRDQRTREIADCMRGLKTLAEKLECPILLGSQLNRNCELRGQEIEKRKGLAEYRPVISDLAESSTIAHDSDVVVFITRQEQYDGSRENQADILCAKNRSGQTFEETMQWSGELCSFFESSNSGIGL